jgi:hypothetical protein
MQESDSLPEHERVWRAQLEAARQADDILLMWFLEAHPEHLDHIRYLRRDDGADPVPCFTTPKTVVDYAEWRLEMDLGNRGASVELLTFGQVAMFVQREQAAGRLPSTIDVWSEARRILRPSL